MFSACWVAQDYSHRTPGRAQSCQERPRNIIFRPNRWRRRAPPPPHHQITSRARRTTSSAPYSPVPFLRSDSVLRLQGSKPPATSSFPSLSLSRGLASACLLATPPVPFEGGGGGGKPGGRGKRMASEDGCGGGNPPGDAAAAPPVWNAAPAAGAGCGDLEEDLRFQCCVCLWVTPRLLSVFFFSAHVVVTFAGVWADDPLSLIGRSCCVITRPRFWSSAIRRLFSSLIFSFLHRFYALYIAPFLNFCVVILSLDIVNVRSPSRNTGDEL